MTRTAAALTILVLTYSVVAIGKFPWLRLDRAGAAFVGAVAMVVSGALPEDAARDAIDYHTLALLLFPRCCCSGRFFSRLAEANRWR